MKKMYDNEPDWPDSGKEQIVDSISAPAFKAVWKTKYSPANEMDSLLYQREPTSWTTPSTSFGVNH